MATLCTVSPAADAKDTPDNQVKKNPDCELTGCWFWDHTNNPPYVPPYVWDEYEVQDPLNPGGGSPDLTDLREDALTAIWENPTEPAIQTLRADWDPTRVLASAGDAGFTPPALGSPPYAAVPAPGALALFGLGMLATIARRRRG